MTQFHAHMNTSTDSETFVINKHSIEKRIQFFADFKCLGAENVKINYDPARDLWPKWNENELIVLNWK